MALNLDGNCAPVQAFVLTEGLCNLVSGSGEVSELSLVYCVTDGDITVNFATPVVISMVEGGVFAIPSGVVVDFTGTAGKFHGMRR